MGQYLIPGIGEADVSQAIDHLHQQGSLTEQQVWDHGVEGGVLFSDPARTDAQCEALYSGFATQPAWRPALHDALRTHAGHLRDYEQAIRNGTAVTNAQTTHVIADIIAWIRLSEDRL